MLFEVLVKSIVALLVGILIVKRPVPILSLVAFFIAVEFALYWHPFFDFLYIAFGTLFFVILNPLILLKGPRVFYHSGIGTMLLTIGFLVVSLTLYKRIRWAKFLTIGCFAIYFCINAFLMVERCSILLNNSYSARPQDYLDWIYYFVKTAVLGLAVYVLCFDKKFKSDFK